MEDNAHKPGHAALRRFRTSWPDAAYFITANIHGTGLEKPTVTARIMEEWRRLEVEKSWLMLSGVVMPDHVHLLIRLCQGRSLSESMRMFRGRLAPVLRTEGLRWQGAYYEHRLRKPDEITPVIFYIYLNPHRAGLLEQIDAWPGYYCRPEEWAWFRGLTASAAPQPEWLR
ncbi:MAG TPA: transposase [Lacunisphaera sp.]|nr:transposase [Lacunisphaera sp.]